MYPVHWTARTQYAKDNEATYIFSLLFDSRMHSTILSLLKYVCTAVLRTLWAGVQVSAVKY